MEDFFDQIITVVTTEDIQLKRLQKRDGNDLKTHKNILKNQWSLSKKQAHSNFVIENDENLKELIRKVEHLIAELFD